MEFLPLFPAMPRFCHLCGGVYLGGSVCSVPGCARTGLRQRDLAAVQHPLPVAPFSPPMSSSPRNNAPPSTPSSGAADPTERELTFDEEMAELRGLLHELMEVSVRIIRRFGIRYLHREVALMERVARVWGARYIRWP